MYVWLFRNIRRKKQSKNTQANILFFISGLNLENFVWHFISWYITLWWSLCLSCWVIPIFFFNFVFNFQGFAGIYIFLLHNPCRLFIIIRQVLRRSCKYRDICVDILMHASIVLLLHIDADLDIYIFEISKLLARQVAPFADRLWYIKMLILS